MNQKYIHILSIALVIAGAAFVTFLYWAEPKSLAEVTSKGSVLMGTYEVNNVEFDQGVVSFRQDKFPDARAAFERADPEKRDAATQFYVAYSYYRQGWGRVSNDDDLFRLGLAAVERLIAVNASYRTTDETLAIKTPAELKNEFDEGLKVTPDDFNPLKLTRERK